MADPKMNKDFAQGMADFNAPSYDSDTDLPTDVQRKIQEHESNQRYQEADQIRQEAWKQANAFPKIKKFVKTGLLGDKQEPDKEE